MKRANAILLGWVGLTNIAFAQSLPFEIDTALGFDWESYHRFANQNQIGEGTLRIAGALTEEEANDFNMLLSYFEAATGIDTQLETSESYDKDILSHKGAGFDISLIDSYKSLQAIASSENVTPLGSDIRAFLAENYAAGASFAELVTFSDANFAPQIFALPFATHVKSLIWYRPDTLSARGARIPQSFDELIAVSDRMVAEGTIPWCIGIASPKSNGWPATDWVEEIMIRTEGGQVYDDWVANRIPFTDARVTKAMDEFGIFAKTQGYAQGDAEGVITTDYKDSIKGLFDKTSPCAFYFQDRFVTKFLPEEIDVNAELSAFQFPPKYADDTHSPTRVETQFVVRTSENPLGEVLIGFLQTPIAHEIMMAQGGFATPMKAANVELYSDKFDKIEGEVLLHSSEIRLDASEQMPPEIGADLFWSGMVDYVKGEPASSVASRIQTKWDSLKAQ